LYKSIEEQWRVDGTDFHAAHHQRFVEVACPACGQDGPTVFAKYGFGHRLCDGCQTLYCSPRPPDELLAVYYNEYPSARMWGELLRETAEHRRVHQHGPRLRRIEDDLRARGVKHGGHLLDLGAGSGIFAGLVRDSGFFDRVSLLEISEASIAMLRQAGFRHVHSSFDELADESVDVVTMNDLLEHLHDPLAVLGQCLRVLRPGGHIAMATPNGRGFDFMIMGRDTGNIVPPCHLTYFNPASVRILLERAGFVPVSVTTPGVLDVEIMLRHRDEGYDVKSRNAWVDFLLDRDEHTRRGFQTFLSENGLSSHMLVLGARP
jgi:SAM-dependent methyltransferase